MKKHYAKKSLSLFLALLMLITAVPLTAVPAAAAGGTLNQSGWAIISSNAQRVNTSEGTFTVCSDGAENSTSVGFIDFDISKISGTVDAKLNISAKNSGSNNYNGEAFLEIFSINPSKRPNVSGATKSNFNNIFGSSGWAANSYTNANNAKNTLGVKNQPAIAVMKTKDMDNGQTKSYSFDISEAVNNAKRAGQSKLCLAFLNPRSYKGNPSWSDINVYYNTATVTYTEPGSAEVPFSAAVTLYKGDSRGTATQQTICSDGSSGNTTAVFVKFDISSVSSSVDSVSFVTSAWRANSSNQSVVANIYSVDKTKVPSMTAGKGDQTTQYYDNAFGTGTPNMSNARTYFGAGESLGQITTKELSTSAQTITRDITSAVKKAKQNGESELCLMFINPTNYSGNGSNGWSDIYLNPTTMKLVCSGEAASGVYGSFNSGLYYVKLVTKIENNRWWNNGINKLWIGFYYKTDNGTGEEQHVDMPVAPGTFASADGYKVHEFVLDGFPTRIDIDCGGISDTDNFECQVVSLSIGSFAGNYTQLQNVTYDKIWKLALQGQNTRKTVVQNIPNNQYPYAKTFDWKTEPAETFVPYSGSNSVSAAVVAKDQYGVVMGTEYTPTIEKYNQGNIMKLNGTGLTASKSFKSDYTVTVNESAKVANTDWFNGKLTVSVASANSSNVSTGSKFFKIVNQKETVTIDPNGGNLSNETYQIYYGSPLDAQINKELNGYSWPPTGTKEGYTLDGIYNGSNKIESSEVIYSNADYTAQWNINKYTVTFLGADGKTVRTETVDHGKNATAPTAPKKESDADNHYTFEKWDTDFSKVTSDLTVTPVYKAAAHNFVRDTAKDKAATCEGNAVWAYKCSDCGYTKTEEQQNSAVGHKWQENGKILATCEKDGSVSYLCSACGKSKTEVLSATGHNYVETVINEPSCETPGLKKYICSNPGCKKTDPENGGDDGIVMDALGHDWTDWTVSTEATCDTDGLKTHTCKRAGCGKTEDVVINRTGHTWSTEIFTEKSTCTKQGRTYKKCLNKNCEATDTVETLPLAEHTLGEWTTDVEPTCVQNGSKVQICPVCGGKFNRTEITALGHDYQNYEKISDATCTEPAKERGTCSRCSTTDTRNVDGSKALGHNFLEENYQLDNNATCEKNGTKTATCTRCTATDTIEIENSALGHSFKKYKSNNDATCEKDGTKTATCEHCDKTDTVTDVGSKKAHSVAEYTYNNDATCTSDGTKTGICSTCGNEITVTATGTKLPHNFENYTLKSAATCLENATEEGVCSVCGATDVRIVEGTKGEHSFPDPETEPEKYISNNDSTCKQHGTKSAYCTVCKKAKKTISDPTSELTHKIVYWISDNNATCTEDGTKHGTCVYCGEYTVEGKKDEGSALGHWFRDYKFDENATCTENGTRTATCEREGCNATETVEAKNTALGHDWSDWAFIEGQDSVDCTTGGKQERHCLRADCSESETRDVEALGHTWTWVTVKEDGESTDCTKGYYKIKECSVCHEQDITSKTVVPGGAHNFVVSEYVEPTCTKEGKRVVSCSVCSTVYSSEILPMTGHINYSLDEKTVKAPTCIEEGYTGDYICDVCGEIAVRGEAVPVSDEHVYTQYVITTPATCTTNAIETAVCSVCGKEPVTREVPSSALGHTFSNYVLDGNATCTGIASKTSKCDRCDVTDTVKVYGTALGHDWSEWKTTKEATCAEKGEAEKHCQREGCGVSVTKELRQLSHTEGEWIVDKEPTCTQTGHRYKECIGGCGTVLTEETIKAKGHSYEVSENTATCIDDGFLTYKCTVCGDTKNGGVVHALGHERGEWEITKAPTCTKQGKKIAKCTVCGTVVATEVVETVAHADNDGDGYCDECSKDMGDPSYDGDCGCICHKTNPLMKFLYKILRALWKLFHIRKTCYCKAVHY